MPTMVFNNSQAMAITKVILWRKWISERNSQLAVYQEVRPIKLIQVWLINYEIKYKVSNWHLEPVVDWAVLVVQLVVMVHHQAIFHPQHNISREITNPVITLVHKTTEHHLLVQLLPLAYNIRIAWEHRMISIINTQKLWTINKWLNLLHIIMATVITVVIWILIPHQLQKM